MKIVWNLVRRASTCCRREKSLNGKRLHPDIVKNLPEAEKTENAAINTTDINALLQHLPPLVESQTIEIPKVESQSDVENQSLSINTGVESVNQQKPEEPSLQTTSVPANLNVCHKKNHSDGEATSTGDGAASSEDSENDEIDGEPHKKRKLDIDGVKEEDRITQEWDNDMKLIKRNLGRISRLFEVYDGYRDKKNPLTINSDLIIQESVINKQNSDSGNNSLELVKLQTSLVATLSPSKVLGRQQLFDNFKQVTEVIMPEIVNGENSLKGSMTCENAIDISQSP